jgi:hypothetical protein
MKRIGAVEWNDADELYLLRRLLNSFCRPFFVLTNINVRTFFSSITRLSEIDSDKDIAWTDLAQTWPRASVRSHQWLRAKWKRLKSTLKSSEDLSLKGDYLLLSIGNDFKHLVYIVNQLIGYLNFLGLEICHELITRSDNLMGSSASTDVYIDNCPSNSIGNILSEVGIAPAAAISAPGVRECRETSSVVLSLPCNKSANFHS